MEAPKRPPALWPPNTCAKCSQRVGVGSAVGAPNGGYVVDFLGEESLQVSAIVGELTGCGSGGQPPCGADGHVQGCHSAEVSTSAGRSSVPGVR